MIFRSLENHCCYILFVLQDSYQSASKFISVVFIFFQEKHRKKEEALQVAWC